MQIRRAGWRAVGIGAALLCSGLPAVLCSAEEYVPPPRMRSGVTVGDGRIEYSGMITAEANKLAFALYEAAEEKPKTLAIASGGGKIELGIELGTWVHEKKLTVEIHRDCFSSCANYVFTAASHVLLGPWAVVGWHGGATQKVDYEKAVTFEGNFSAAERKKEIEDFKKSTEDLIRKETAFFKAIGVDQRITVLGQDPANQGNVPEGDESSYIGWYYSLEDLKRLGVRHVDVVGGAEWTPFKIPDQLLFRVDLGAEFNPLIPAPKEGSEPKGDRESEPPVGSPG